MIALCPSSTLLRLLQAVSSLLLLTFLAAAADPSDTPPPNLPTFHLEDQFGVRHTIAFPRKRPLLLLVGDRRGSEEIDPWIEPLKKRWGGVADLQGIADVQAVPRFLRNRVTDAIRKSRPKPLLLDFEGKVTDILPFEKKTANIFVIATNGTVRAHVAGPFPASPETDPRLATLAKALAPSPPPQTEGR